MRFRLRHVAEEKGQRQSARVADQDQKDQTGEKRRLLRRRLVGHRRRGRGVQRHSHSGGTASDRFGRRKTGPPHGYPENRCKQFQKLLRGSHRRTVPQSKNSIFVLLRTVIRRLGLQRFMPVDQYRPRRS